MDASWRTALEAEFTKPYFRKVTFRGFAHTPRRMLICSPQLKDFLILETKSHQVYPPGECIRHDGAGPRTNPCIRPARDIYSWSQLTPLDAVKAVVIGQARPSSLAFRRSNSLLPYVRTHTTTSAKHTVSHPGYSIHIPMNQSCFSGLSFSVLPPTKLPGSLKNIYKQLARDIPTFSPPTTGSATSLLSLPPLPLCC